jgi:predicted AAA+ superfamily ATPase
MNSNTLKEYSWYEHYSYLLDYNEIFETLFPGRDATNKGHGLHNDVIIITGKKGVGKTEIAKMLAYIFSTKESDKFVIFCGIPDLYSDLQEALGKDKVLQMDLEEVEEEGDYTVPPVEMFENVFVIFDDTEKHESKEIEKMFWRLVNSIAQKGRNYRTTLICILHHLNKGLTSTTLLREMDALIIFPRYFDMNTFNSIIHHIGIPKHIVEALYKLDERFILIRNSAPQYFFLGTSMQKTNNYNTILRLAYGDQYYGKGHEDESESDEDDEANIDNILGILRNVDIKENGVEEDISGMPSKIY